MKKRLTITISIAALILTSCNNDLTPQNPNEKESEEQPKNGRTRYISNSKEFSSSSNENTSNGGTDPKSSNPTHKDKVSRGGFGHGGGIGGG